METTIPNKIGNKIEKSSKTGQDKKSLISTFAFLGEKGGWLHLNLKFF